MTDQTGTPWSPEYTDTAGSPNTPTSLLTVTAEPQDDLVLRGIPAPPPPSEPPYASRERTLFAATLEESKNALALFGEVVERSISDSTLEYETLNAANHVIKDEYLAPMNEMVSSELLVTITKARANFQAAEEFSSLIFDVERQVSLMEAIVAEMDAYTIALEDSTKRRSAAISAHIPK